MNFGMDMGIALNYGYVPSFPSYLFGNEYY